MKHVMPNILTNKERRKLIKDCQPHLIDGNEITKQAFEQDHLFKVFPGKQTRENLHHIPCFQPPISKILSVISQKIKSDIIVDRSWINWTNGKKKDMNWHDHRNYDLAAVYYMKTLPFSNNATLFKDDVIEAPQNSLLVFPGHLEHSAPTCPFRFERYTLSFNLNIVR